MTAVLELNNIAKTFGFIKKVPVLQNVNLQIYEGESLAIIGANGSGKTTLMHIIAGIYKPTSGTILYKGHPFQGHRHLKQDIALCLPNGKGLPSELLTEQYLKFKALSHGKSFDKTAWFINLLGVDRLMNKKIKSCSTGEIQRINLAGCLSVDPRVILFDEPTNGLDLDAKHLFFELLEKLKNEKRTIVLISHHIDEISKMNRYVAIKDKTIQISGSVPRSLSELELQLSGIFAGKRGLAV